MTEFWVSTPKHYCEICKIWISSNINNIKKHENSEKHLNNKRNALIEMRRKETKKRQFEKQKDEEIKRIELEAKKAVYGQQYKHLYASKSSTSSKDQTSSTSINMPFFPPQTEWQLLFDISRGQSYWYNRLTNECVWVETLNNTNINIQYPYLTSTNNIYNNINNANINNKPPATRILARTEDIHTSSISTSTNTNTLTNSALLSTHTTDTQNGISTNLNSSLPSDTHTVIASATNNLISSLNTFNLQHSISPSQTLNTHNIISSSESLLNTRNLHSPSVSSHTNTDLSNAITPQLHIKMEKTEDLQDTDNVYTSYKTMNKKDNLNTENKDVDYVHTENKDALNINLKSEYLESSQFTGKMDGYVFKNDIHGIGYYIDKNFCTYTKSYSTSTHDLNDKKSSISQTDTYTNNSQNVSHHQINIKTEKNNNNLQKHSIQIKTQNNTQNNYNNNNNVNTPILPQWTIVNPNESQFGSNTKHSEPIPLTKEELVKYNENTNKEDPLIVLRKKEEKLSLNSDDLQLREKAIYINNDEKSKATSQIFKRTIQAKSALARRIKPNFNK